MIGGSNVVSPVVRVASFFYDAPTALAPDEPGLLVLRGTGSGTVITEDGYILTNSHVICDRGGDTCGCADISESFPRADFIAILCTVDETQPPVALYRAQIVDERPDLDVALVKITHSLKLLEADSATLSSVCSAVLYHDASGDLRSFFSGVEARLSLQPVDRLDLPVAGIGNPLSVGLEGIVTVRGYPVIDRDTDPTLFVDTGSVAGIDRDEFLYITKAFTAPGSSGGAIFDEKSDALIAVLCGRPAIEEFAGTTPTQARPLALVQDLLPDNALFLPRAAYTCSPEVPEWGQYVDFDATGSEAVRGNLVQYEWDLDGDGAFDDAAGERVSVRMRGEQLSRSVGLRVTDSQGLSHSVTRVVPVAGPRGAGFDPVRCTVVHHGGNDREEHDNIQDCLDCANPGDRVELAPGTYKAAGLRILSGIELETAGYEDTGERAVLVGNGVQEAIQVNAAGVTLKGLTITNGSPGLLLLGSADAALEDCVFARNLGTAVRFDESAGTMSGCEIRETILDPAGRGGDGILLSGGAEGGGFVLMGNVLTLNAGAGVVVEGQQVVLQDNEISENDRWGIRADASSTITGHGNTIQGNRGFGVHVGAAEVHLWGGEIQGNRSTQAGEHGDGVFVSGLGQLALESVEISQNDRAGVLAARFDTVDQGGVPQARLVDTTVRQNLIGVICEGDATVEMVEGAVLDNTPTGVLGIGAATLSIRGTQIGGNALGGIDLSGTCSLSLAATSLWGSAQSEVVLAMNGHSEAVAEGLHISGHAVDRVSSDRAAVMLEGSACTRIQGDSSLVGCPASAIRAMDRSRLELVDVMIAGNGATAVRLEQNATAALQRCVICCNAEDGVDLDQEASAAIHECWISDNAGAGVFVSVTSALEGSGNVLQYNPASKDGASLPDGFCIDAPPQLRQRIRVEQEASEYALWDAIRWAAPGGVIELPSGSWRGGLVVSKSLSILGIGAAQSSIRGSAWDGICVMGEGALSISDIHVADCVGAGLRFDVSNAKTQSVQRCRLEANREGIVCEGDSQVEVRDSELTANICHGLWALERSSALMEACDIWANTLPACAYGGIFDHTAQGAVEFGGDSRGLLAANLIRSNLNFGVEIVDRAEVQLLGNRILDNARWGIIAIAPPCFEGYANAFEGGVTGAGNQVQGNGIQLSEGERSCGDGVGEVCPADLSDLMTPQ
jgi:hypothetical protein